MHEGAGQLGEGLGIRIGKSIISPSSSLATLDARCISSNKCRRNISENCRITLLYDITTSRMLHKLIVSFHYKVVSDRKTSNSNRHAHFSICGPNLNYLQSAMALVSLAPAPETGPDCMRCGRPSSLMWTRTSNRNGNAGRPYYKCIPCNKFLVFNDTRGNDPLNPHCYCNVSSKRQLAGRHLTSQTRKESAFHWSQNAFSSRPEGKAL